MFKNQFTPTYGGRPDFFFGREDVLRRFDVALVDSASDSRSLFVTGTRGIGKTALLEQLSQKASRAHWCTIDLSADHMIGALIHNLVGADSTTRTVAPQVSMNLMGIGGGFGGVSTSKTTTYSVENLQTLLIEACKRESRGLFVSIDEIQKVPLDDVSAVCSAFQGATRKGYNAILVVAGLPYSYDVIIHHEGCTFMRRSVREKLTLLSREVVRGAYEESFRRIDGLEATADCIGLLVDASLGHPYMMQLLGYYLIAQLNVDAHDSNYVATRYDAERVIPMAISVYEDRALRPLVDELTAAELDYLVAMSKVMGSDRVASTADVARVLQKKPSQLSRTREGLMRDGIIISPARGKVRFSIAYLRDYLTKPYAVDEELTLVEEWGI